MNSKETTIYVDDHPNTSIDDVRSVAAHVISGSPITRVGYEAWSVDDENIAAITPGARWAIDIQNLREPELSKLAAEIRDALTRRGLSARLESEIPELSG